jgi:hypothetical protein
VIRMEQMRNDFKIVLRKTEGRTTIGIPKLMCVCVWTGFIWRRIESGGWLLGTQYIFDSHILCCGVYICVCTYSCLYLVMMFFLSIFRAS